MPFVFRESHRPKPWRQYRWRVRNPLLIPFLYFQWLSEWAAWFLGQWVLLEVLEYCGTLSILIGVIFYFAGAHDRREQKHYQAWQVINTAQGKGGNGGRIDALEDLNSDGVSLTAVDLSGGAYLRDLDLPNANLARANIAGADLRGATLHGCDLELAALNSSNFRGTDLTGVHFNHADLTDADLNGADLTGADLSGAVLDYADLRNADLSDIQNWKDVGSMSLVNIVGCKNAPEGFRAWALANGAVEMDNDKLWYQRIDNERAEGEKRRIATSQPSR